MRTLVDEVFFMQFSLSEFKDTPLSYPGGVKIFSGEECSAKRHQGVVFLNQGIFMDVDYLPMAIHTYRLSCTIVQVLSRIRYLSKKVISLTCHQVNHEKLKDLQPYSRSCTVIQDHGTSLIL